MHSSTWAAAHPSHQGALLDRGFRDLTVLDISAAGMRHARDRLGSRADQARWLTTDVLRWHPERHYQAWHDRAVYHFLTVAEHRQQYLRTLDAATAPGAVAVFVCFAPDGPQRCSGLPAARYSPAQLARQVGAKWLLISQDREEHRRAHHPRRHHPAIHLDCPAKTVISPDRPVETIVQLVGHAGGSQVTETVCLRQIRPVLSAEELLGV